MMYLWAFVITGVVGVGIGLLTVIQRRDDRRRGGRPAWGLRWATLCAGVLGVVLLVLGFEFPQLRGRKPPWEGLRINLNAFIDPLVLSSGLGGFAVVVGLHFAFSGDRTWAPRLGLAAGAAVTAIWLFFLVGRFIG